MRITKKELNQKYNYIILGGYCEFQTLCRASGVREVGNASGLYGWNWTAYEFETSEGVPVVVCTGYRDMTGEKLTGLEKYEQKARKIWENYSLTYEQRKRKEKANAKAFANCILKKLRGGAND